MPLAALLTTANNRPIAVIKKGKHFESRMKEAILSDEKCDSCELPSLFENTILTVNTEFEVVFTEDKETRNKTYCLKSIYIN